MSIVAAQSPDTDLYGFDLWMPDYGGIANPGPQFVQSEIAKFGANRIKLITGDSHQTLPAFLAGYPGQFDLIFVDGDHSKEGARQDLLCVLPRVAPGGVIVFDDLVHPQHLYLEDLWREIMQDQKSFLSATYTSTGYGVAIAVPR